MDIFVCINCVMFVYCRGKMSTQEYSVNGSSGKPSVKDKISRRFRLTVAKTGQKVGRILMEYLFISFVTVKRTATRPSLPQLQNTTLKSRLNGLLSYMFRN